jgi:hypothetical protein
MAFDFSFGGASTTERKKASDTLRAPEAFLVIASRY